MTKSECIYCNAIVADCTKIPATNDRDGWQAEAAKGHENDCEWIETRAHKTDRIRLVVDRTRAELEAVRDLAEEFNATIEIGEHMCVENVGSGQYAGVQMLGDLHRACGL